MIVIGIIIIGVAMVLALLNMLLVMISVARDSDRGLFAGIGLHIFCGILAVVGIVIVAIGLYQELL